MCASVNIINIYAFPGPLPSAHNSSAENVQLIEWDEFTSVSVTKLAPRTVFPTGCDDDECVCVFVSSVVEPLLINHT